MAYSWSIAGGVVTLTLDGTGSGPVSRSRTFTTSDGITADELHTFYLVVDPSVVAVGAFLEVDGGDTTVADETGSQTLRARGTADGSGNITVRFGAQSIESASNIVVNDPLEYNDYSEATAADWVFSNTTGDILPLCDNPPDHQVGVCFHTLHPIGDYLYAIRIHLGAGSTSGRFLMSKDYALTPGVTYLARLHVDAQGRWSEFLGLKIKSGAAAGTDAVNGNRGIATAEASVTADGTGVVTVEIFKAGGFPVLHNDDYWFAGLTIESVTGGGATIDFSQLTYCLGSGQSETGGTGAGSDGTDPLPNPPEGGYTPTTGVRPFGAFSIPAGGLGYWNSVVKQATPTWIKNIVDSARTGSCYPSIVFGQTADWLSGGIFSYARWQASVDAFYANTTARAILQDAIDDGTAFAHYLIDEPYWSGRWGIEIPLATLEKMALYSKSLWPTWPTTMRFGALQRVKSGYYLTRHINGLDWLWAQYWSRDGNVTAFRDDSISRADDFGHQTVIGINIGQFLGTGSRAITPAEWEYNGSILASSSDTVAFMAWEYQAGLYGQSGFPASTLKVRDRYASFDP